MFHLHLVDVEGSHKLREGELLRDAPRDADLVDPQVGAEKSTLFRLLLSTAPVWRSSVHLAWVGPPHTPGIVSQLIRKHI